MDGNKKEIALRYALLSEKDRLLVNRELSEATISGLEKIIDDLEQQGISRYQISQLRHDNHDLFEEKPDYKLRVLLGLIKQKALSSGKEPPEALIAFIQKKLSVA